MTNPTRAAARMRPARSSVRELWGKLLVAHPERLEDDFLDPCVASQVRNHPTGWAPSMQR